MKRTFCSIGLTIAFVVASVATGLAAATIGNTTDGTSTDTLWYEGAYINACRFRAASNMTVVTMHAKVSAITGRYKCAIYSDSSSQPNRLLRATSEVTNPTTDGWKTFTLTAPQALTNGSYYWLAIWSDSSSAKAYYSSSTSGTLRWAQRNYGTWPDPIVTTGGSTSSYCIYAMGSVAPVAPTVAILSPANNGTVGTNFTITATATDSDGTVTNVSFYDGVTLLGSDTSSPYSYVWNNAPLGAHALRAVARDNSGLATTSAVVNVTITALNVVSFAETFDSYANGTVITNIGGGGFWTSGANTVVSGGGVNGSGGLGTSSLIFNWKAQTFQWSALDIGTRVAISLDLQTSGTGKFDDDRVGWTITPDASTSTGSQLALQLDNTTEGGMVLYHNLTRTPVLNALSGIKNSTWYRFKVEFTKLSATSAKIVGTLTELDASGNPDGTPYVGTVADTSMFANPPSTALFTSAQQCPTFKNHNPATGNADNATFTITQPGPQPPIVTITSPTANETVFTSFTINATATDDGSVTNVGFYADGILLGNDTTSSYSWTWNGAPVGNHTLTAVAVDDTGLSATSAVVNVIVSTNLAPNAPVVVTPADGAMGVATNATLTVSVSDPNGDPMSVLFYARSLNGTAPAPDFTIVALPDTQFYSESYPAIFQSEIDWIVNNHQERNIVYVTGLGDVVNVGTSDTQFRNATNALYRLENPVTTGLPEGIPYGVPVGNHDSPYTLFNNYFGVSHFSGRSYYGGSYTTGYQNHYDLFSAGGMDFIVLSLEYNAGANSAIMSWANGVLQANADRRAIVVTHSLLQAGYNWPTPAAWSTDGGTTIFPALANNPNVFLMLCGHNHGQGRRHEAVGDRFIDVLLSDYQSDVNGGNGFVRLMEFSPSNNVIRVTTYSPYTLGSKTDGDNQFTLEYAMASAPAPFVCIGTNMAVASGTQTSLAWPNLAPGTIYEWYAVASDATTSATSATSQFLTAGGPPAVALSLSGSPMAEAAGVATVTATLSEISTDMVTVNLEFSGTATLTDDYTRSGASISIPAGSLTGSITLTAVQDSIYENPDETIVVDISTVVNAKENGTQQVTATIAGDDPVPPVITLLDQNFDSLGSAGTTMPTGWTAGYLGTASSQNRLTMSPYAGNGLNITALPLVVSDGSALPSPNVGTIFNIGSAGSSERALGSYPRTTPSGDHVLQVAIVNTTGGSLTAINVSYVGEQWRQSEGASESGLEMLRFLASTTSPTAGFSYFPDLDFTAPKQLVADWPVGVLDGNLAANRAVITGTITFASPVPAGGTFYLRWHDWNDDSTSDHFLAIDDLVVTSIYMVGPAVTLSLSGSPMAEAGGVATVTATLSQASTNVVKVNLAFAGTATLTDDYTRSGTSISIPAGSLTGSITLTAVQDGVHETPDETIVVDISSVDNGTEIGTQQVTATIADDDAAAAGFTAYNDCSKGDGTNPANTTEYPGNGSYSGLLKDFDTGATLPVTLTLVTNRITYDGTGGPMPNAGTDAHTTFNGKVVFDNVIWYTATSNGFWMDAVFTGLDPAKEYEFATSVNRGGSGSDYGSRYSKFTITDMDSAENGSTPGVTVNSATSVTFCSGINTVNGYVARWTKIKCGSDGDFTVRVEDGGGVGKGYAFDGIMLRETGTAGPQQPTVAITSPVNNATLSTNFTITASAADSDGTVTNVYFYNGSTLLGSDSSSPYTFTWSAAPLGAHALKAVAWDNTGLAGTSAVVNITVTAPGTVAAVETFDSYANGLIITNIGGGGVWTSGTNIILSTGGVNGSAGISFGTRVFNWKAQTFQWSALPDGTKVAVSLDLQTSATGKFDDDRAGWTITPDTTGSTGSQLALQLDNTTEGGMVFYHNSTRTPVLNALSGIKNSTWYRFNVEFTKLGLTNASIVGTLTELDSSGNPTGTPYVGTITNTGTFANRPSSALFTATQQCPSFKNHSPAAGNADNATFTITPPEPEPPATPEYVIVISVDGMGSAYVTPLLTPGLANELTTFKRFQTEGSGTLNARTDYNYAITLPNHVCMMTCRGVSGASGHNWTGNSDPAPTATLANNKGSYVASGWDVAHDNALRTGIWSGKSKFSLFQQSYSATSGAPDITGDDNGRDKIDYDKVGNLSAAALTDDLISQMTANPFHFLLLHFHEPDTAGHSSGWSTNPTSAYAASLKAVDTQIARVIEMVENSPTLQGKTAIIVTADHGGHGTTHGDMSNPLDYTIPFYVWGPGVTAGGDLYAMNPASRTSPGTSNPPYTGGQPIRNGDAANLALSLLGLEAIPGSTINSSQDLLVNSTPVIITVTANSGQSKVFGAADPTLTYICSDPEVSFTGALGRAAGENVGSYAINQGNLSPVGGYVVNFVSADFAITAKPVTVTANSGQSKVFGAPDPVLTYTSSELGVSFAGALGRAAGENAGSYAINQGSLSAGANYAITFVPANFAITTAYSTTAISSSLNPSRVGSNVTFTVTVGPVAPATSTPTGTVQFFANSVALGSPVALTGGTATLDTALLPTGDNDIIAFYLGDGNYLGSTDGLVQVVTAAVETPVVVSIVPNSDGSVTVTCAGTPGAEYLVLSSTNITSPASWVNVSTNTAGVDGQWTYTDNTKLNYTQRFFRAAKP